MRAWWHLLVTFPLSWAVKATLVEEVPGAPEWVGLGAFRPRWPSLLEGQGRSVGRSLFSERLFHHGGKSLTTSSFVLLGMERDWAPVLFGDLPYLGFLPNVPQSSTKCSQDCDSQMTSAPHFSSS